MMSPQNLYSVSKDSQYLRNLLVGYFFMLLAVMAASNYFTVVDVVTTLWLGNISALVIFTILLFRFSRFTTREAATAAIMAVAIHIPAIIFYGEHIFDNMKSLGQNANILSLPCYFIITGILANECLAEKDITAIFKILFYTTAIVAIFTLLTNINTLSRFATDANSYEVALNGIFPTKNNLGIFCCIGIMAGFYLFYVEKKKLLLLLLWGGTAIVLVLALSRAAILMFAVFLFVFVIKRLTAGHYNNFRNIDSNIRKTLTVIIAAAVILFMFSGTFQDFIVSKILREDAGSAGRTDIWADIIENFDNNIIFYLFGMGFGELNYRSAKDSHNIYINIFTTGGISKCIAYIYIFGKSLTVIRKLGKHQRLLADLCFSVVISYLVFGIFETLVVFEFGLASFELALLFIFVPIMQLPKPETYRSAAEARRISNAET